MMDHSETHQKLNMAISCKFPDFFIIKKNFENNIV